MDVGEDQLLKRRECPRNGVSGAGPLPSAEQALCYPADAPNLLSWRQSILRRSAQRKVSTKLSCLCPDETQSLLTLVQDSLMSPVQAWAALMKSSGSTIDSGAVLSHHLQLRSHE